MYHNIFLLVFAGDFKADFLVHSDSVVFFLNSKRCFWIIHFFQMFKHSIHQCSAYPHFLIFVKNRNSKFNCIFVNTAISVGITHPYCSDNSVINFGTKAIIILLLSKVFYVNLKLRLIDNRFRC